MQRDPWAVRSWARGNREAFIVPNLYLRHTGDRKGIFPECDGGASGAPVLPRVVGQRGTATVSTLNSLDGTVVANAALVPAGASGEVTAFTTNLSHLLLDINGYFR